MSWFNILKNEMRNVNLPKFKVNPFNVNKPEEDTTCRDKMLAMQQTVKNGDWAVGKELHIFDNLNSQMEDAQFWQTEVTTPKTDGFTKGITWEYNLDAIHKTKAIGTIMLELTEYKYTSNNNEDKIPEEVYCKALDLVNKPQTAYNQNDLPIISSSEEDFTMGDFRIIHINNVSNTYREEDMKTGKVGGTRSVVYVNRGMHIMGTQRPYAEFHMSNRFSLGAMTLGQYKTIGDEPAEADLENISHILVEPITKLVNHLSNIKFKWN